MPKSIGIILTQVSIALFISITMTFTYISTASADNVISANLIIKPPGEAAPGVQLSFKGIVYNNPSFSRPPGTRMRCWIIQPDFTRVTESIDIDYPAPGKTAEINFIKRFTIPADAEHGTIYDFYLAYGIFYPISSKKSVQVKKPGFHLKPGKLKIRRKRHVPRADRKAINPQPEPPGKIKYKATPETGKVSINPQPEPPGKNKK